MYRLTWRLPLAGLVAFSHLQFSQIRGRQPYLIVRNILYVIHSDNLHAVWLLRARRQQPRSRSAANERDELATAAHSITKRPGGAEIDHQLETWSASAPAGRP